MESTFPGIFDMLRDGIVFVTVAFGRFFQANGVLNFFPFLFGLLSILGSITAILGLIGSGVGGVVRSERRASQSKNRKGG